MAGFSNPFLQLIYFLTVFVLKKKSALYVQKCHPFPCRMGKEKDRRKLEKAVPSSVEASP